MIVRRSSLGLLLRLISHAWQQRLKWAVYSLLFLDFILYAVQDAASAAYTLGTDASLLEWARAYVTSIDLAAWLLLILCFELETYRPPGRTWPRSVRWGVHGVRLLCCVVILHTTFTVVKILDDFRSPRRLPDAAQLCDYTGGDWSFLRNRGYTDLDEENCAAIGTGPAFFVIDPDPVITDRTGLREGLVLAWTDVVENVAWLLIVLANEIIVRVQARGVGGGATVSLLDRLKAALYAVIACIALYWGSKAQMLYMWDEFLWIFGFLAIEKNLLDWREARGSADRRSPPVAR